MKKALGIFSLWSGLAGFVLAADEPGRVSAYHVVWDSPSKDCGGSMPLGNGDIGLNAWVEPSGQLVFYIGKTDSWGDNGRLLKVGKVRVTLDPAPPVTPFRQELSLIDATMKVRYGDDTTLNVWVDANRPVIHVQADGPKPVAATATIELWRTERYALPSIEASDVMMDRSKPNDMHAPTIVEPDTILTGLTDRIGWYHYNTKSVGPAMQAEIQGMTGYPGEDPLLHRIFGALVTAPKAERLDDNRLRSADGRLDIHVLTQHPSTPEKWLEEVNTLARHGTDSNLAAHRQWWSDFWNRSWINATAKSASLIPPNAHPLRVGEDQKGQNKFRGELRNVRVPESLAAPLTLEAEVKPVAGETGRIFDKVTPGGRDGFLLDTHPGNALRLVVGAQTYSAKDALKPDEWARVVLTADEEGWRVSVNGKELIIAPSTRSDDAAYVSQMYALQRFITACAGRGRYPIKFNGSLFTVAHPGKPGDADYRRWGPGYWWQNTRLPYISLCASGDFEMMEPLWRLYVDDFLTRNKYRTQQYFGFEDAAFYNECLHFWGDVFSVVYGWQPVSKRSDPLQESKWHKREWVSGLELVWMMLNHYEFTSDKKLLEERIIPTAHAVLRFFDLYYKTNADGKLVMHPSQALETWWDCTNPMPELAGLRAVTARLLTLPESAAPAASRAYWKELLAKLPPLPTRDTPSGQAYAPAERFANKRNAEQPELYVVFPFRLCSFEKENLDLGLNALKHRWNRGHNGWSQDDIFMAYLGLADDARQNVVKRAIEHDKGSRFPAFWGPNIDWVPDQDHGGVLMKAFQSMLMQTEGRKIFLLPAWPQHWNGEFKLHAPYQTVVQGHVEGGKVVDLKVTPESRRADVQVIHEMSHAVEGGAPIVNCTAPAKTAASRRPPSGNVPTILALGDSITQGGGKTFVGYREALIPELRRKQVKVEFIGPNRDAMSAHAGYSNKNAGDLRSMIKDVYSQYSADIVLLHAGHNNFSEKKPVPGVIRDTEAILRTIWAINPKAVILLAQVIPAGKLPKYSYIPELNVELAALADRLAAEGRPIVLVNQAEGFDWKTDTIKDLVHPNASGAKKMADQWMKALLPILENHEGRRARRGKSMAGSLSAAPGIQRLCGLA
jgi:lysophospholipase L1-like esterase